MTTETARLNHSNKLGPERKTNKGKVSQLLKPFMKIMKVDPSKQERLSEESADSISNTCTTQSSVNSGVTDKHLKARDRDIVSSFIQTTSCEDSITSREIFNTDESEPCLEEQPQLHQTRRRQRRRNSCTRWNLDSDSICALSQPEQRFSSMEDEKAFKRGYTF